MDVNVKYQNDVHCVVDCDSSIAQELTDFFTFDVPGARFMPTVRNKVWDGKIRLFNSVTRTVYAGLADYIAEFCKARDYTYDVDPKLRAEVVAEGSVPWLGHARHAKLLICTTFSACDKGRCCEEALQ